jgi:hypothetical protein
MKSSFKGPNPDHFPKSKTIERLTEDWGGIDHPLWRMEIANKVAFTIETLLCIVAMSANKKKGTDEGAAALACLITLTGWDFDEFQSNLDDVMSKVDLLHAESEGGMQ